MAIRIYKTKKEIAQKKGVSVNSVNNWEMIGRVEKLFIDNKKDEKKPIKAGYVMVNEAIKQLASKL